MLGLSPLLYTLIFSAAFFGMGVIYGRGHLHHRIENIIESTLDSLIKEGYLRWKYDSNGEIEIMKWNELDG